MAGTIMSLVGIRRCNLSVSRRPYSSYSSKHLFLPDLRKVISLKGDGLPKGRKSVFLNHSSLVLLEIISSSTIEQVTD